MTGTSLYFTASNEVELRDREIPEPTPKTVRVESIYSAISAGTEGLVFRGEVPDSISLETDGPTPTEEFSYPTKYGYATVGLVTAVGRDIPSEWLEKRVFAYNPHESHFLASPDDLVPIPEAIPTRIAPMLANMETAVNFLLDGKPVIGGRVVVFGQGVVGLLTTGLLAAIPLESLCIIEPIASRRERAMQWGADEALDTDGTVEDRFTGGELHRPDLTYELSGNPAALDTAIAITCYDGAVVVGSWYGTKSADVRLGEHFHRNRIDITSSQVSTIAPSNRGRWSRDRRHALAWQWLEKLPIDSLITHEFSIEEAAEAYHSIETSPDETLQVLLQYDS